jgi:hypothetical protein
MPRKNSAAPLSAAMPLGREQRHQSVRGGQRLRALDEQAVEIHVATAEQRIVAALAQHPRIGLRRLDRLLIFRP